MLSLLQALERSPELEASTALDFLLFNCREDRREVLEVARHLRSCGYTAARDIIRREYDASLAYARRMNIRCMLVIGDEAERGDYRAVRVRDGETLRIDRNLLQCEALMEFIDQTQGE